MKENIKATLDLYVNNRIPTGSFLQACLENNLAEAFGRADEFNRENLFEIVQYIYNDMPSCCWGSREIVKAWLAEGRKNE